MSAAPIAVLVVDDSVVVRRLVAGTLSDDPAVRVAGTAASGREALAMIPLVQPDILTLDIEMPDLDGLATLRELRRLHPHLPVIMFSTATESGAAATLEALALGARDYVTKPANVGSVTAAMAAIRSELLPKIKVLARQRAPAAPPAAGPPPGAGAARPRTGLPHRLLALGASTGGPEAIARILRGLPADLPVPVVVAQHMPPMFTRLFAKRLNRTGPLRVVQAEAGIQLDPGLVVVAPGDRHLLVHGSGAGLRASTSSAAPENSCRPSVDVLFRSVAEACGSRALACVLTGMGQDGLRGCERLVAAGAEVVVQDEQTSVVWGMPGAVSAAGLAERTVPLETLAGDLTAALRRGASAAVRTGGVR